MESGDDFVIKLISSCKAFTALEVRALSGWWGSERQEGESLTNFLIRREVFTAVAARTIDMARKGYISLADTSVLFGAEGVGRLKVFLTGNREDTTHAKEGATQAPLTKSARISNVGQSHPGQSARASSQGVPPRVVPPTAQGQTLRPSAQGQTLRPSAQGQTLRPSATGDFSTEIKPRLSDSRPGVTPSFSSPSQRGTGLNSSPLRMGESPVEPGTAVRVGMTLGKCLLTEQVGQGASGKVFRALHTSLGIPVAVKVLQFGAVEDSQTLFDQFRGEARLLARLNHPNVIRVLDFEDQFEPIYLVLEFVEGFTLAELIEQSGRVRADRAVNVMIQVCEGLKAAHAIGIVHRDVKPANILIAKDGIAKLSDLGLAIVVGANHDGAGQPLDTIAGTAAYMAPEQVMASATVDHRADIYSLGATFYHAVTGQLPFRGRSRMEVMLKHTQQPVVPPHELIPELDVNVSAIIVQMLEKDPLRRFESYQELLQALQTMPGRPIEANGQSGSSTSDSKRSRWRDLFNFGRKSDHNPEKKSDPPK